MYHLNKSLKIKFYLTTITYSYLNMKFDEWHSIKGI